MWLIWVAIFTYQEANGEFPDPVVIDSQGNPLISWRCLLINYLEPRRGFEYIAGVPWSSPEYKEQRTRCPRSYVSVSPGWSVKKNARGEADYLAIVGDNTWWGDPASHGASRRTNIDQMIMLVESQHSGVNWLKPEDVNVEMLNEDELDKAAGELFAGSEGEGVAVLFRDGEVWILKEETPMTELAKFFTATSASKMDRKDVLGKYRLN